MLASVAAAGAATLAKASPVKAREKEEAPSDAVGILFDATRCVGCRACVAACKEANENRADDRTAGMEIYDAPTDLNDRTRNIVKLYKEGDDWAFVKNQCMHCIDAACVGACMIGALQKREYGIVSWDPDLCVGCRYCQVACPFNVPKFEWESALPQIVKCEMCRHRVVEGQEPACCEVCPRGAAEFGKYTDLLAEAKRRIAEHPDQYVPKVYGETDFGGTQVLYLSHVPFEKLGFKVNGGVSVPHRQQTIQHGIYQGFTAPAALYAVLGGVMLRHRRMNGKARDTAFPRDVQAPEDAGSMGEVGA
jgi:Fe-S-cluster-containing dehydrogenase component